MRVTYDPEADAAYIYLVDKIAPGSATCHPINTSKLDAMIVLDADGDGRILGIEVLGAKSTLPSELLAQAEILSGVSK